MQKGLHILAKDKVCILYICVDRMDICVIGLSQVQSGWMTFPVLVLRRLSLNVPVVDWGSTTAVTLKMLGWCAQVSLMFADAGIIIVGTYVWRQLPF